MTVHGMFKNSRDLLEKNVFAFVGFFFILPLAQWSKCGVGVFFGRRTKEKLSDFKILTGVKSVDF